MLATQIAKSDSPVEHFVRRPYDLDDDFGSSASVTVVHHQEERPTCKMTPDQLLGLQRHARAKTMSPEITIETGDAVPTVIASGTQESVPITVDMMIVEPARGSKPAPMAVQAPVQAIDDVLAELAARPSVAEPTAPAKPSPFGAILGFALFGAWTAVEIVMLIAR